MREALLTVRVSMAREGQKPTNDNHHYHDNDDEDNIEFDGMVVNNYFY